MAWKDNLKKVGAFINPPKTQDQIDYEKRLKDETIKARRESFLKESVKQSRLKARSDAKKQYAPQGSPFAMGSLDAFAGMGMSQEPRKKKLKQKIKQDKGFDDILWRM